MLVLLVRGELLRRFPTTLIYARKAVWNRSRRLLEAETRAPRFHARLDPDLVLFGLPLTPEQARGTADDAGWFIVFQQPPTEPRFGLDEAEEGTYGASTLERWSDLHWGHLAASPKELEYMGYIRLATQRPWMNLKRRPLRAGGSIIEDEQAEWGHNAAHMAQILFQPPVQIAIHATDLLPADDQ
jgi:hypothetical protein